MWFSRETKKGAMGAVCRFLFFCFWMFNFYFMLPKLAVLIPGTISRRSVPGGVLWFGNDFLLIFWNFVIFCWISGDGWKFSGAPLEFQQAPLNFPWGTTNFRGGLKNWGAHLKIIRMLQNFLRRTSNFMCALSGRSCALRLRGDARRRRSGRGIGAPRRLGSPYGRGNVPARRAISNKETQ